MPNSLSAEKRLRQNHKQRIRNKSHKTAMKTQIKKFFAAVEEKSPDVETILALTYKSIDQVAAKGIIHKNKAARIKSRLTIFKNKSFNQ